MKIYVASSWRNEKQQHVVRVLREDGHDVYDYRNPKPGDHGFSWAEIDPNWKNWTPLEFRKALTTPIADRGFRNDFDAMSDADAFVLVLPCGRSAHLETGWATARPGVKSIVLLAEGCEPELMYKQCSAICVTLEEVRAVLDFDSRSFVRFGKVLNEVSPRLRRIEVLFDSQELGVPDPGILPGAEMNLTISMPPEIWTNLGALKVLGTPEHWAIIRVLALARTTITVRNETTEPHRFRAVMSGVCEGA